AVRPCARVLRRCPRASRKTGCRSENRKGCAGSGRCACSRERRRGSGSRAFRMRRRSAGKLSGRFPRITMTQLPVSAAEDSLRRRTDFAGWFVPGAIAVAILFLASAHAPVRIRLPLLYPLTLGALAGWGLGTWWATRRVTPHWVAAITLVFV